MMGMSGASKTIRVGDNFVGLKGKYVVVGQGVEDKLVNELITTNLDSFIYRNLNTLRNYKCFVYGALTHTLTKLSMIARSSTNSFFIP
jgi:hypothetical protein